METKPPNLDALRIDRSQHSAGRSGVAPWLLLIVLAGASAGGWWYFHQRVPAVKTAVAREFRPAGEPGARTLLNASGYVTTRREATVSSKITGKVTEILVEEGMKVEAGQVLANLDTSSVTTGLQTARARLEAAKLGLAETEPLLAFAEAELKRLIALEASGAQTRAELGRVEAEALSQKARLERQRAEIRVAERQVDEWTQQLDDAVIRAPFAGVVTTKDAQPGEMISPMSSGGFTRTGICTLVDMGSLEIEVDVGESFINRVKAGQPVQATLDAYADWKIPCKVIAIIPTADRQKATVKVRVAFEKLDPRILPQMGVKVAFQSDEPAAAAPRDVISVPKAAVQTSGGRDIAWVVRDGKAERRAVTVAERNGTDALLSAGLAAGETVILDAPPTLSDGTPVKVENPR